MRKLDIIESNIEPDKNNIWLKDDKLLVFLNGEYKDIVKQSFNYNLVDSLAYILPVVPNVDYFGNIATGIKIVVNKDITHTGTTSILLSPDKFIPAFEEGIIPQKEATLYSKLNSIGRFIYNANFLYIIILRKDTNATTISDIDYKDVIYSGIVAFKPMTGEYTDTPFTPSQFTEIPITIGSYNIKCKIKNMSFSENTKSLTVNVVKEESE